MHHSRRTRTGHADKGLALLGGLGLGALLMYVFDPQRGARRRALVRDKAVRVSSRTAETLAARARDLRNRGRGVAAKTRSLLHEDSVSDEVVVERVRSRLGRAGAPGTLDVSARNGTVTVAGAVSPREADGILDAIRSTPGVEDVDDRLELAEDSAGEASREADRRDRDTF